MSPRRFGIICIATLIAVVALAMVMAETGPQNFNIEAPQSVSSAPTDGNALASFGVQPLGLPLSITIVADMGLMTLGLVILFKDETPDHYRVR